VPTGPSRIQKQSVNLSYDDGYFGDFTVPEDVFSWYKHRPAENIMVIDVTVNCFVTRCVTSDYYKA